MQTRRCNACGAVYDSHTSTGNEYAHVCPPINVDGVYLRREGHRDENRIYTAAPLDKEQGPDAKQDAWEEHTFATLRRATMFASEGPGFEVLHEGPRTPAELGQVEVVVQPLRAKRVRSKAKGKRNVKARR